MMIRDIALSNLTAQSTITTFAIQSLPTWKAVKKLFAIGSENTAFDLYCYLQLIPSPIALYIDADACPVKSEVYRVAERFVARGTALKVVVVANAAIAVPRELW